MNWRFAMAAALTSCALSAAASDALRVGGTLHGFKVRSVAEVPDAGGRLWRLEYEKNGADLVWLERADPNKTFAIAFRTPPSDDTGIPHILEHSVLCGSERFPVKEPFVELLKSSFSTYLNAYTSADHTCYPVSSRNGKDFLNLAEVYLDAVFHPLSVKEDGWRWRQEGWHYEVKDGRLVRNGVVLSEMKGRLGAVERLAYAEVARALFPDNAYGRNSGGAPERIPDLTFAKYRDFYERFYHPSNARVFLDGDLDIVAALRLIDSFLREYPRREIDTRIPRQKPVSVERKVEYPSEKAGGRLMLADGWVFGDWSDRVLAEGLDLVVDSIAGADDSPLRRALVGSGICRDVSLWVDGYEQLVFNARYIDVDPARAEECRRVAHETMRKALEGLDPARLAASLSRKEFGDREMNVELRGHLFMARAFDGWLYGGDPAEAVGVSKVNAELRAKIGTDWFAESFRRCVLDNPHCARITLVPSSTLGESRRAAEESELADVWRGMSQADRDEVARAAAELERVQKTPDSPEDLAKLPRLSLSDVPAEGWTPTRDIVELDGTTVIRPKVTAPGIAYLDLSFSLQGLSDDELADCVLLAAVLGELPTARRSAQELRDAVNLTLGDFSARAVSYTSAPRLDVRAAFLVERRDDALSLVGEMLRETRFGDKEEVGRVRGRLCSEFERRFEARGCPDVMAARGLSARRRVADIFGGVARLRHFRHGQSGDLAALAGRVFVRERLVIGATDGLDEDFIRAAARLCPGVGVAFRSSPAGCASNTQKPAAEGFEIPTATAYAAMSAALPEDAPYHGSQIVASRIASLDWLWQKVRVEGGAYGGGLSVESDGTVTFSSWMDPKPAGTFGAFSEAGRFLVDFAAGGSSLAPYQISTLSRLEPCLSPREEVRLSERLHFNGRSPADLARLRREILGTSKDDIRRFGEVLEGLAPKFSRCAFGPAKLLSTCGLTVVDVDPGYSRKSSASR